MIQRMGRTLREAATSALGLRALGRRLATRMMAAPRTTPEEGRLGPELDALGGEVLRLRSRDGLRLSARWLPAEPGADWSPDPHEAILLLHGWTGSIAPDVVEYGPFLRRTAGVLGIDFRGHGGSDDSPTTMGMREVDDVGGALAWIGERGVTRVGLFGTSMGGITALAAVAVLGDGSLAAADLDPSKPAASIAAPRPLIVGVVADSVFPELGYALADRFPPLIRRPLASLGYDEVARRLGADPRETEPLRVIGLVDPVPLLLIHGDADPRIPARAARALAAAAGPSADHWLVAGAGHTTAHRVQPDDYEARVTTFLRTAFLGAREAAPIIAASSVEPAIEVTGDRDDPVTRSAPIGRHELD
jgi:pimeloyl-ACP methyl ester carboxylesterase